MREPYKHLFWCLVTRGQDHRGKLVFSALVGRSQNIEIGVEKTLRGVKLLVFRATCRKGALVHNIVYTSIQTKHWEQKHRERAKHFAGLDNRIQGHKGAHTPSEKGMWTLSLTIVSKHIL